jgi:arylsulfatase A-like enzyme
MASFRELMTAALPKTHLQKQLMTLVIAAIVGACSPVGEEGDGGKASRAASPKRPNVVILVVDTLRADHLSTYGYARRTSPYLDRVAEESVVFESAFTVMSHTLPAHISLVTGVHPATHQVLSNGWRYEGPYPTLGERLRRAGYETAAFVSGFPLPHGSGFERGFDTYRDTFLGGRRRLSIDGEVTNRRAIVWLRQQGGRPFFLVVHYFDTHQPYTWPLDDPPPFTVDDVLRTRLDELAISGRTTKDVSHRQLELDGRPVPLPEAVNAYDNLIWRVDRLIEGICAELARLGLREDTLLIVTSDHGEGLGQHSYFSHGLYLYEEQLRIPLIVRAPAAAGWEPRRIRSTVSLLDVAPTVLELAGLPLEGLLHGRSLRLLVESPGLEAERRIVAQRREFPEDIRETREARFAPDTSLHAVRGDDPLKYLRTGDGAEELYDLGADPYERRNLAEDRPEDLARMRLALEELLRARAAEGPIPGQEIDEETREALRALGYVQ